MTPDESGIDQQLVKALAHPLRVRILTLLNDKVASPSDVAEELGEPLANVSYHFHVLNDMECIELVDTKPRRGAIEHYYRAQTRPFLSDEDLAKLPATTRQSLFSSLLRQIIRDVTEAARGGGFERPETHVSRTPLVLDEQGSQQVTETLAKALERILEIQEECTRRMTGEEQPRLATNLAIMHFEGAAGEPSKAPSGGRRKARAGKT
jgi:DNA-binding transcriptional ArsR family regulator